jgi:hypothetical protein
VFGESIADSTDDLSDDLSAAAKKRRLLVAQISLSFSVPEFIEGR